ncbi:hypothetical protein T08_4939 [Trichinella sp. T8]|nr:hypothetical protein T08_4939 [Trichinella sp. T8]
MPCTPLLAVTRNISVKFLYKLQSEEQQLTVKASSSASAQPKLRSSRRCEYYSNTSATHDDILMYNMPWRMNGSLLRIQ